MHRFATSLLALAFLGRLAFAADPAPGPDAATVTKPVDVAEQGLECIKTMRFADYAKLMRQEDKEDLRAFLVELWTEAKKAGQGAQIAQLVKGVESPERLAETDVDQVVAAYLEGIFNAVPNADAMRAALKFESLGEIVENEDTVHVVARSPLGAAELIPCHRGKEGDWKLGLRGDIRSRMVMVRRAMEWRRQGKTPADVSKLAASSKVTKATLLGLVGDGDDLAYAVVRANARIAEVDDESVKVYPIRRGDAVWNLLDANDPTGALDAERRAKIEAAFLKKWSVNAALPTPNS